MALELPLSDPFGNSYPAAYRKFAFLAIDAKLKSIRVVFDDYKDVNQREANKLPFAQVEYRIGPAPVPAKLGEDGVTVLAPAIPDYDTFASADARNPSGIGALVYGFAKTRPENATAKDV